MPTHWHSASVFKIQVKILIINDSCVRFRWGNMDFCGFSALALCQEKKGTLWLIWPKVLVRFTKIHTHTERQNRKQPAVNEEPNWSFKGKSQYGSNSQYEPGSSPSLKRGAGSAVAGILQHKVSTSGLYKQNNWSLWNTGLNRIINKSQTEYLQWETIC